MSTPCPIKMEQPTQAPKSNATSSTRSPKRRKRVSLAKDHSILNPSTLYDLVRTSEIIIEKLDSEEEPGRFGILSKAEQGLEATVLYGAGAIGKSSIALKIADTLFHRGDFIAVFWVQCDTPATMLQSFTTIALEMKLPGTDSKDHKRNCRQVLDWLTCTSKSSCPG